MYKQMSKKFEDFLFTDKYPDTKILKFSEYRKGSSEFGQLFQDLMMILRLKKEKNKEANSITLTKQDLKNIDMNKIKILSNDTSKMRKLGMSFDIEFLDNDIVRFYNLNNTKKETRPWENLQEKLTHDDLEVGDVVSSYYRGGMEGVVVMKSKYHVRIRWNDGKESIYNNRSGYKGDIESEITVIKGKEDDDEIKPEKIKWFKIRDFENND